MPGDDSFDSAVVKIDTIEDARWREANGRVVEIVRTAKVYDIAIPDPANARDLLLDKVLRAPNVPRPGNAHPHRPELIVQDRDARALSTNIAMVSVTYRLPDGGNFPPGSDSFRLTGGTGIEQISTMLDRTGTPIVVTHEDVEQGGFITPYEARSEITAERTEQLSNPLGVSTLWTNAVNTGGWSLDPNAQPRTWLVAGVNFELVSQDTIPFTYRVVYNFRQNPDGFDPQVVFIDPETGNPPPNLTPDEGYKTIPWYTSLNFNLL